MKLLTKIVFIIIVIVLISIVGFFIYAFEKRNPSKLNLCGWGNVYPYYVATDYYKTDFFDFKEYIHENYDSQEYNFEKNIIIRVQFMINCKGEIGNFKVQAYNFDYNKISISENMTIPFVKMIEDFNKWSSPQNKKGESINIFKFYAFKFKNGHLIEILPK